MQSRRTNPADDGHGPRRAVRVDARFIAVQEQGLSAVSLLVRAGAEEKHPASSDHPTMQPTTARLTRRAAAASRPPRLACCRLRSLLAQAFQIWTWVPVNGLASHALIAFKS